jgi:hypothetical protein
MAIESYRTYVYVVELLFPRSDEWKCNVSIDSLDTSDYQTQELHTALAIHSEPRLSRSHDAESINRGVINLDKV